MINEERKNAHTSAAGMSLYLVGMKKTDLDVSWYRAYDYSDIARDMLGFNFKQFLLDSVKLYANARYDLTAEVFNEALAGVKYFPTLDLILTGEYYESYPTFDTTSIFSVFAVDKYKEGVLKADYTVLSWLGVSAGYIGENFGEGGDANVYEVGFRIRPNPNFTVGLFYDNRSGYGGDLSGNKLSVQLEDFRLEDVDAGKAAGEPPGRLVRGARRDEAPDHAVGVDAEHAGILVGQEHHRGRCMLLGVEL